MTTTFNFKAKKDGQPLYKQLARYFRDEIQEDHLQGGDMLPSIRKLTKDLKVSRTTVEAAYEILIDQGYVQNLPKPRLPHYPHQTGSTSGNAPLAGGVFPPSFL